MKLLFLSQFAFAFIGSLSLWLLRDMNDAWSYASGSLLVTVTLALSGFGWSLIFRKKLIALAVSVIVIKYAILGLIVFELMHQPWLQPLWFGFGVASFVGTSLIYAFAKRQHGV